MGPATNKVIRKGEVVSMGVSPSLNGYHGIMRRTVKAGADWTFAERVFMETLEGLYHTVMKATAEAARKAGKYAGTVAGDGPLAQAAVAMGYQLIAGGGDAAFLRAASQTRLNELQTALSKNKKNGRSR